MIDAPGAIACSLHCSPANDALPPPLPKLPRFRPQFEVLEARDVPATHTWLGGAPSSPTEFNEARNWSSGTTPLAREDLIFDGSVSSVDCMNLTGNVPDMPGGGWSGANLGFNSIRMINHYAGTVTVVSVLPVNVLELASPEGAISQPLSNNDNSISVATSFNWTGGTLNSSDYTNLVHLLGGSVTTIDPGALNTIITGSTLSFEYITQTLVGSTATVQPGTVLFANAAGAIIGSYSAMTIELDADVTFKGVLGVANPGSKMLYLDNAATMTVKGVGSILNPRKFTSELPVYNNGGMVEIKDVAIASIKNRFPDGPSYLQNGGNAKTIIEDDSILRVEFGYLQNNGILGSAANINLGGLATLDGNAVITGGVIDPNYLGFRRPNGTFFDSTLRIARDLDWQGGSLWIDVNGSWAGDCDLLSIGGVLTVGNAATVSAIIINLPPNGIAPFQTWQFLTATGGVPANQPPVTMVNGGVTQFTISAFGTPPRAWRFNS